MLVLCNWLKPPGIHRWVPSSWAQRSRAASACTGTRLYITNVVMWHCSHPGLALRKIHKTTKINLFLSQNNAISKCLTNCRSDNFKISSKSLAWMKEKCQTITCLDEKQETQIIDCIWESRPLEQNINNWTKMQKCSDKRNKLELTPVDFSKFSNFPSTSATLTLRCSSNQALNWSK